MIRFQPVPYEACAFLLLALTVTENAAISRFARLPSCLFPAYLLASHFTVVSHSVVLYSEGPFAEVFH